MSYIHLLKESEGALAWVFIHGWGSDNKLWDHLRESLLGDNSLSGSHYAIDLPGFGCSSSSKPKLLQRYLEEVEHALPSNCILLGWSLGGMIASQLAARNPQKVKALITLSSNPSFVTRADWPWAMNVQTFNDFLNGFQRTPQKTWVRFCGLQSQGCDNAKSILKQLKLQTPPSSDTELAWQQCLYWLSEIDNRSLLAKLDMPSLHLFGEGDCLVPDEAALAVQSLGLAKSILIKGGGHCLHLSQPQSVTQSVSEWLQNVRVNSPFVRPQVIEKQKIARSFGASAVTYDAAAQLQKDVATDLLVFGRSMLAKVCPPAQSDSTLLDLGCGTGYVSEMLLQKSIKNITLLDIAEPMVKFAQSKTRCLGLTADAESLPFSGDSLAAVVSSLAVQWCNDLTLVSQEVFRTLLPGGYFLFTTLGPKTLFELKESWAKVNGFQHVNEFQSFKQVKSDVCRAGFNIEAIESSCKVVQYSEFLPILKDLKSIGAHNMNAGQNPGLTPARQFKLLTQEYEKYRDEKGLLPVTYDVIFVLAKKERRYE